MKQINLNPDSRKTEMTQINQIRNFKKAITNTTEMKRIIKDYCKQLQANKMENIENNTK